MKSLLLLVSLASTCACCLQGGTVDDRPALVKGYSKWKKATAQPQDMTPALMLSCIGPSKWDQAPNPHVQRVFEVFVNKVGEKAMMAKGQGSFPVGTVIVKEKRPRGDRKTKEIPLELATVMVKRGPDNWEYFALDGKGRIQKGDTQYCADCHLDNKENDYVWRNYVPGASMIPRKWDQ